MKCPVDHNILQMTERQGVEIDYCPQCRGIWLGRGELDKIIDRAPDVAGSPSRAEGAGPEQFRPQHDDGRSVDDRRSSAEGCAERAHDQQQGSKPYKKKRKESFLGELFDF